MSKYKHNNCKVWIGDLPTAIARACVNEVNWTYPPLAPEAVQALFRTKEGWNEYLVLSDKKFFLKDERIEASLSEFFELAPSHTIRIDDSDPIELTEEQFK